MGRISGDAYRIRIGRAVEFTAVPVAVPPTLTIFVQNEIVHLDQIKIPAGITVTMGGVPTLFHQFNTKDEKVSSAEKDTKSVATETLDPAVQATADKITAFLKKRVANMK